jgi:hypothetical protein
MYTRDVAVRSQLYSLSSSLDSLLLYCSEALSLLLLQLLLLHCELTSTQTSSYTCSYRTALLTINNSNVHMVKYYMSSMILSI